MAHIVLINPRFEVSYWGYEYALAFLSKKANMPITSLPLLAALMPAEHTVTLIDESVEPIDFEFVAQADIVGVTGLSGQRFRQRAILTELKRRGVFTVVGGPMITGQEDYCGPLADVIFVGEAEETWPRFLREWQQDQHQTRYEQDQRTDMTQAPVPRFDLLKMRDYAFGAVQFSRGCPFQCEFCDIIVTFGRRPRIKTSAQVIAELEGLRAQKMRMVFVVDDNLVGNKKEIKVLLRSLVEWQQSNGYPLLLVTEASIDLADDAELMQLMVDANFSSVFVGIESPNEASLHETKKFQNFCQGPSILDKVHTIQNAGLDVWCGMILGFDHDDDSIFAAQRQFLSEAHIAHASVDMLYAIPKTPLHTRLAAENRLDPADPSEFGTNVIPLQIGRQQLREGYVQLMNDLYEPAAFFERLEHLFLKEKFTFARGQLRYWRRHPWSWFCGQTINLLFSAALYVRLMRGIPDSALRREYHRRIIRLLRVRREPIVLFTYLIKCAMHYHHYTMSKEMRQGGELVRNMW